MTGLIVTVFLFEYVPDFGSILNSTLQSLSHTARNFNNCDPYTTDFIWQNIKINNDFKIDQNIRQSIEKNSNMRLESNLVTGKSRSFKKTLLAIENDHLKNEIKDIDIPYKKQKIYIDSDKFPNDAPFLVAIFETLSNITAQTCGGILLSAEWVVTPAACLDMLSNYNYSNGSTQLSKNHYSIVTNANNPLEDGAMHNVTEIFLCPDDINDNKKRLNDPLQGIAELALMKIEPSAVRIGSIVIFSGLIVEGIVVRVYGWILKKNSNGQYAMSVASFTAKTLDSDECKSKYGLKNRNSVICLLAMKSKRNQISQMTSGGPVVIWNTMFQILGVVQLDLSPSLIVHPLANHYEWISNVMDTKNAN